MPRFALHAAALLAAPVLAMAGPARVGPAWAADAPGHSDIKLVYDVYAHGLRGMQMIAQIRLAPGGYSMTLSYHTMGFANMLNRSRVTSVATGSFDGDRPVPTRFQSSGYARGEDRDAVLTYHDGQPTVVTQTPAETDRDPVAASATGGSVDTLSAIMMMMHDVAEGHGCVAKAKVFDGLRLSDVDATDGGEVDVGSSDRSPYSGQAHLCNFVAHQIGGILHDSDEAKVRQPMHGSASLAIPKAADGGAGVVDIPVPIRAGFENPSIGYVNLFLVSAGPIG